MTYFLTDDQLEIGKEYTLKGEEASHILKSRRLKKGESFNVQGSDNRRFKVSPSNIQRHKLNFTPLEQVICPEEPTFKINLFQALVKEKATDFIIQKATELGVSNVCFFESKNSQLLKNTKDLEKKLDRWNKIALEACKQCDRLTPPKVLFQKDIQDDDFEAKDLFSTYPTYILDAKGTGDIPVEALSSVSGVNLIIGPEGGFSADEFQKIKMEKLYLGPRILRADTAAISSVVLMQYLVGDLSK